MALGRARLRPQKGRRCLLDRTSLWRSNYYLEACNGLFCCSTSQSISVDLMPHMLRPMRNVGINPLRDM